MVCLFVAAVDQASAGSPTPLAQSSAWLIATLLIVYVSWHYYTYGNNYPGPHIYPFVGCLPGILKHVDHLYDWSVVLLARSKTNTIRSMALGLNEIVTADPANVEHVLKTNFSNYPKGPEFQEKFRDLLGHGIFNSDDEVWKTQRKTASLEFSARSLRDLMVTAVRDETINRLLPTFRQAMETGTAIDVQEALLRYTFDNICRIGFGVDPGCLAPDLPEVSFAKSFDVATKATLVRNILPPSLWKLYKWLHLGSEAELERAVKSIDQFADDVIQQRRKDLAARPKNKALDDSKKTQHTDILSRFMMLGEQDRGQLYSDRFLRDACTNFILAGRDTSSVALSWFFWLLTWHPRVEGRILDELHTILEARPAEARTDETFSYDELKQMSYLHAALSESLRLYPSVPADTKYVVKDDYLPDGTFVKKGWRLTYLIYAMGRMERVWGADACEFKPERWLGNDGTFRAESPFKFPAFNAGPRLCLGRDMAYLQMKSVAATIIRNFCLKLVPGHPIKYSMSLTLFMKHGLLMRVHPR